MTSDRVRGKGYLRPDGRVRARCRGWGLGVRVTFGRAEHRLFAEELVRLVRVRVRVRDGVRDRVRDGDGVRDRVRACGQG
jgi:hypothetical protein